jgi:hypothetical protein
MVTRAAKRHVPASIAAWCACPAEVATEVTRRPTGPPETPARVRARSTRSVEVNAEISTRPGPWPQGRRALTAEARAEIPRRRAGAVESCVEVGIRAAGPAEVPTEVGSGSSRSAEASLKARIGCTGQTVRSTWPTEVTAQCRGRRLSRGVRSGGESARAAGLSRCWAGSTAMLTGCWPGSTAGLA